jgi:ferric-dicitrate binding protein FerR (iron transport regulator)
MNWSLLAKYIFNEAKKHEKEDVEQWSRQKPENKSLLDELKLINYSKSKEMEIKDTQNVDVDKAWNKFKERITESSEKKSKPVIRLEQRILKYAATVLILIGIGTAGYFIYDNIFHSQNYITLETQKFETQNDIFLPDGSVVSLNDNSKIYYPKKFDVDERLVKVKGEAFFDIEKDPVKPFIISANKARIEVLGTSFNVRTDLPEDAVEVYVQSGIVEFYKKGNRKESVILNPGYVGILKDNKLIREKNNNVNYLAWKTGKMLFKENTLENVVNTLNNAYNVHIEIADPEISSLTLSASFENEPIQEVLNVISKTFDIQITKKGKHQYIIESND